MCEYRNQKNQNTWDWKPNQIELQLKNPNRPSPKANPCQTSFSNCSRTGFYAIHPTAWKHSKKQQVHQQTCKTHIPPYGLKQCRRPQFQLPTKRRRRCPRMICQTGYVFRKCCRAAAAAPGRNMPPPPWLPTSQCSRKGEKTCLDSRPTRMQNFMPYLFPPLRNP